MVVEKETLEWEKEQDIPYRRLSVVRFSEGSCLCGQTNCCSLESLSSQELTVKSSRGKASFPDNRHQFFFGTLCRLFGLKQHQWEMCACFDIYLPRGVTKPNHVFSPRFPLVGEVNMPRFLQRCIAPFVTDHYETSHTRPFGLPTHPWMSLLCATCEHRERTSLLLPNSEISGWWGNGAVKVMLPSVSRGAGHRWRCGCSL